MFKDDLLFFKEMKSFMKNLPPLEIGILAFDSLFDEWLSLECVKETSSNLQEKCRILFLLAHVNHGDPKRHLQFIERLILKLDTLDYSVKYPI